MAQAAEAAGASAKTVAALRQDVETRRDERQTVGGRLDAARAKAQRTVRLAEEARAALAKATARLQEAERAEHEAAKECADIETSLAVTGSAA